MTYALFSRIAFKFLKTYLFILFVFAFQVNYLSLATNSLKFDDACSMIYAWEECVFHIIVVPYYCSNKWSLTYGWLKKTKNYYLTSFGSQKYKFSLSGLISRCGQGWSLVDLLSHNLLLRRWSSVLFPFWGPLLLNWVHLLMQTISPPKGFNWITPPLFLTWRVIYLQVLRLGGEHLWWEHYFTVHAFYNVDVTNLFMSLNPALSKISGKQRLWDLYIWLYYRFSWS